MSGYSKDPSWRGLVNSKEMNGACPQCGKIIRTHENFCAEWGSYCDCPKAEAPVCEHDEGQRWFDNNHGGYLKAQYPVCPFCKAPPQPSVGVNNSDDALMINEKLEELISSNSRSSFMTRASEWISDALATAKEQGRQEGLEEAAKIAEEQKRICGSSMSRQSTCDDIAFNIRKAKEKA